MTTSATATTTTTTTTTATTATTATTTGTTKTSACDDGPTFRGRVRAEQTRHTRSSRCRYTVAPVPLVPEPERRSLTSSLIRPRLRGVADIFAAAIAIPGILILVDHASPGTPTLLAAVYGLCLVILLVGSAIYHRPGWSLRTGLILRKIDHANIYLMIAGSATPIVATLIPGPGRAILIAIWISAALGIIKTFLWPRAPRQLNSLIYALIGCIPVPFAFQIGDAIGDEALRILAIGGGCFLFGGVVYARRWPNPAPFFFGYHEIFHLFVFAGAGLHYAVIWDLVA